MTKQRIVLETKNANGRCYETAINVGEDGAHNFEVVVTHNKNTHIFYQATMRKALDYMEACIDIDKETDKVVSNVCIEQTDEHYETTDEIIAGNLLERETLNLGPLT